VAPQDEVGSNISRIIEVGQSLGLQLNVAKCEVVTHPGTVISDPTIGLFTVVSLKDLVLLGFPLFPGPMLDKTWSDRCNDLSRAVERLSMVGSQYALILLRASFSAPRVHHLLRFSPSVDHETLTTFDDLLRSALSQITNSNLTDTQWLQASLPIKDGGLGVRRVASLALTTFWHLLRVPSPSRMLSWLDMPAPPTHSLKRSVRLGRTRSGHRPPPPADVMHKQSHWDSPGIQRDQTSGIWPGHL